MLRRAIDDARSRGGLDVVIILGDLVNDGTQAYAEAHLQQLREAIRQSGGEAPVLVACGNHDGEAGRLYDVFGHRPGLHEIGGYRFALFADPYAPGDLCQRSQADRQALHRWASQDGGPIIALQHNPLHPAIESEYPFMLTNGQDVLEDYARAGVLLSISGHYHLGQGPTSRDGVVYVTAGSLSESPFPYAMITLEGRQVRVEHRPLRLPEGLPIVDVHVHTQLAYCASGITAKLAIDRARMLGLAGVTLTEHAPQLYCHAEDFWYGRHIRQPALWRAGPRNRMPRLRQIVDPLRSDYVRAGLEVELDGEGRLTVRDEDRDWPDRLLGAVHFLTRDSKELTQAELVSLFMKTTEGLLAAGVDILAHPWRFLQARQCPIDRALHVALADMLQATGTAAEINFHNLLPDAQFYHVCVERGVKLCLGSDGHAPHEAAAVQPHAALLTELAGGRDLAELLLP